MSAMEEVLDGVKLIVNHWTVTKSPMAYASSSAGDTVISVNSTKRFLVGDEFMIRTPGNKAEIGLRVKKILDSNHIELVSPLKNSWSLSENPIIQRTFFDQCVQGVYLGEPDPIPRYPAVTITASNKASEWLTLDSTKETFNLKIAVYTEAATQENGYRAMIRLADIIEKGLKSNFFPLIGPYNVFSVTQDIQPGDEYIKISDTSSFDKHLYPRLLLEDNYKAEEFILDKVIDSETIKLARPVCYEYLVADYSKIINPQRFIYNSWPTSTQYGTVFKGTMLKAGVIDWFAWEENIQNEVPLNVSLL